MLKGTGLLPLVMTSGVVHALEILVTAPLMYGRSPNTDFNLMVYFVEAVTTGKFCTFVMTWYANVQKYGWWPTPQAARARSSRRRRSPLGAERPRG